MRLHPKTCDKPPPRYATTGPPMLWGLCMDRETRPRRASQVVHDDYVMWTHLRVPGVGFAGFRDGDFCAIEEPSQPIDLITHRHGKHHLLEMHQGEARLGTAGRRWAAGHRIVLAIERCQEHRRRSVQSRLG